MSSEGTLFLKSLTQYEDDGLSCQEIVKLCYMQGESMFQCAHEDEESATLVDEENLRTTIMDDPFFIDIDELVENSSDNSDCSTIDSIDCPTQSSDSMKRSFTRTRSQFSRAPRFGDENKDELEDK